MTPAPPGEITFILELKINWGGGVQIVKRQSVQDMSKRKCWVEAPSGKIFCNLLISRGFWWWRNPESNWGHKDFQSFALPTELTGQRLY